MKCKYCGRPAGLFKTKHAECEEKHTTAIESLKKLYQKKITYNFTPYDAIQKEAEEIVKNGYISTTENEKILETALLNMTAPSRIATLQDAEELDKCIDSMPSQYHHIRNSDNYADIWKTATKKLILEGIEDGNESNETVQKAYKIANEHNVDLKDWAIHIIENKINEYLEDNLIDIDEEGKVKKCMELLDLTPTDFIGNDTYNMLIQSILLRDLKEGKDIRGRVDVGSIPILLGKSEYVVWAYDNINAYEEKTGKRYEGGSQGVSIRICKGVYYRVGQSKGHAVDYTYTNPIGSGILAITNKNIIFSGAKAIKFPINKIISFNAYSDGIELQKEGVRAKPTTFTGLNPWFISNVLPYLKD